jgi:hypothetical protein
MTELAERNRPRLPENDRREIAKRIFDALCAKFPEKYVALVQPRGDPTTFEQMIVSMRQRLRPTDAYLLADRLRICIGLNYSKTDETRLLKMLLQEVSLTWL